MIRTDKTAARPKRLRRARRPKRPRRPRRSKVGDVALARRPRRPGVQLHPVTQERAYARELEAIAKRARDLVAEIVIPALPRLERAAGIRSDALTATILPGGDIALRGHVRIRADALPWIGALAGLFVTVRARMEREISAAHLEVLAGANAEDVAGFNKEEMTRQLRASLGVDIFLADATLFATVAAFTETNVALIKTIPSQYFAQVEKIIRENFRKGKRAAQFAPEIEARFGVSFRRARFIARDQVAKLNGQLTQNRQTELGLDEYIWRTSRDERVRHSHMLLEGSTQKWADPPTTEEGRTVHPGEDYNCRCTAEPVVEGIEAIKTTPADVKRDPELVRSFRRRQARLAARGR